MRIFIGWDSRFMLPGRVLAYSLRKHASRPLDIRFLDYRHLHDCYGFDRAYDPLASTEFTYSRFLVPWLCNYEGHALFMDNDMVCLSDICELPKLAEGDKALWCVQHDHRPTQGIKMYGAVQTNYPRKNWSSLIWMDCAQLRCWTREVVEKASGARLHRFQDVHDEKIGELPRGWNDLDHLDADTKIIHYTSGGPWFDAYRDCPHAEIWREYLNEAVLKEAAA